MKTAGHNLRLRNDSKNSQHNIYRTTDNRRLSQDMDDVLVNINIPIINTIRGQKPTIMSHFKKPRKSLPETTKQLHPVPYP